MFPGTGSRVALVVGDSVSSASDVGLGASVVFNMGGEVELFKNSLSTSPLQVPL